MGLRSRQRALSPVVEQAQAAAEWVVPEPSGAEQAAVAQPAAERLEVERFVFRVQSCEYSFFNAARQLFLHDGANNEIGHQVGELKARAVLQRNRRV